MFGVYSTRGIMPNERSIYINEMSSALCYGSNTEKKYSSENILLGINTGSQSIYHESKNLIVAYCGRMYNCDAEAIANLYEEYGVDCLKRIKGMFSLALWDKNKKRLLIARDRFGIKPLYYYHKNGILAFSSEIKALLKLPFVGKELNMQAVNMYFSFEYIPSPHSIFKDVYKLKPAHCIIYENDNIEVLSYWNLTAIDTNKEISFKAAGSKLKQLINNSIKDHIASDSPPGVFLSGGMDSSTLVALLNADHGKKFQTFSMGSGEKSFDDSKYAAFVSKYFGTKHYNYTFTVDDFINNFYDVTNVLNEPFADMSIFPTYMLSKLTRQHVNVALSGEGGDELFMGYPTYVAHKYVGLFNKLPNPLKYISKYITNKLPISHKYLSIDFKLKQFIKGTDIDDTILRHILWMGAFKDSEKNMLFKDCANNRDAMNPDVITKIVEEIKNLRLDPDDKVVQYLDILSLRDNVLFKSDRAGMLANLEIRVPFLDHELAEFILSLSPEFLYQKRILKKAMTGVVPRKIIMRSKRGFPMPFAPWLHNDRVLKLIEHFFDKNFLKQQGLFNHDYLNFLLKQHLSGKSDNRKKLRTYIMFQGWHENWFK